MKYRIAMWASAGFLVACCWILYAFATAPAPITSLVWTLASLTCPVVLASHFRLHFSWVLLANAATYALVGLIVETLRQKLNPATR